VYAAKGGLITKKGKQPRTGYAEGGEVEDESAGLNTAYRQPSSETVSADYLAQQEAERRAAEEGCSRTAGCGRGAARTGRVDANHRTAFWQTAMPRHSRM
jgi:hypothetical protein